MCNEYKFETKWEESSRIIAREAPDLPARQTEQDLARHPSIKIGDTGTVIRAAGISAELAPMAFGIPPTRKGAGPVFNFRSEGRSFADSNRCLIPASAFFEFTGTNIPRPAIASGWR